MWRYQATLNRVIDGDTIDVIIDLGFRLSMEARLRLLGIDAPELRGPTREAGQAALSWLSKWLSPVDFEEWGLEIETRKSDVFGRYLARVWRNGVELAPAMVEAGHAVVRQ